MPLVRRVGGVRQEETMKPVIYHFRAEGDHIPPFAIPHKMLLIFHYGVIQKPSMYSLN